MPLAMGLQIVSISITHKNFFFKIHLDLACGKAGGFTLPNAVKNGHRCWFEGCFVRSYFARG